MRMKPEKELLITRMEGQVMSFLLNGSRAVEIHCDPEEKNVPLGNIYIGRVQRIVKNIGAAFVEILPGTVCYLAMSELKEPIYTKKGASPLLQEGDELLVQVLREGIKTKAPAVTTNLTFFGKYALLTTGERRIAASSKLPQAERERLVKAAGRFEKSSSADALHGCEQRGESDAQRSYGWVLRTNAGDAAPEALWHDMERLRAQYEDLMRRVPYRTGRSCVLSQPGAFVKRLQDLRGTEVDRIQTDDANLFDQLKNYLEQNQPEDLEKLFFYEDRMLPLVKCYALERHLSEALSERVWLKSGGYLVIQPTEALTVIDVNTGKCAAGKRREETFFRINQEAAREAARQIRLRNLSGIILIDFINHEQPEHDQALLSLLDAELCRDPIRTVLVDMTRLSLVEITRQKRERPLAESITKT